MTKKVVIVGDLPNSPDRNWLLDQLQRKYPEAEWDWVKCSTPAFNLPTKPFNRLLAALRDPPNDVELIVVKLYCIHGREENLLYNDCPQPILPPVDIETANELIQWLGGDEAALIREPPWTEPVRVAAMLAILAKLIRNKSWNNSTHGHAWTQEADLLGQAPVNRPGGLLLGEAKVLLLRMEGIVLLTKGANQGKTKKEWSIDLSALPPIKQAILDRTTAPLREQDDWEPLFGYMDHGADEQEQVLVDGDIVSETVRYNSREQH